MFKYSAYKNLASLAESNNDGDKAIDLYLEVWRTRLSGSMHRMVQIEDIQSNF